MSEGIKIFLIASDKCYLFCKAHILRPSSFRGLQIFFVTIGQMVSITIYMNNTTYNYKMYRHMPIFLYIFNCCEMKLYTFVMLWIRDMRLLKYVILEIILN